MKDLETAYVIFFKGLAKFPNFKKRSNQQSFRVPQYFSITEAGKLKLPKMTPIKMVIHREIEGVIKSATITQTASGQYYASK